MRSRIATKTTSITFGVGCQSGSGSVGWASMVTSERHRGRLPKRFQTIAFCAISAFRIQNDPNLSLLETLESRGKLSGNFLETVGVNQTVGRQRGWCRGVEAGRRAAGLSGCKEALAGLCPHRDAEFFDAHAFS